MAVLYFLRLDKVPGHCNDARHQGWIQILGHHLSSEKNAVSNLTVTSDSSAAIGSARAQCIKGANLGNGELHVCKADARRTVIEKHVFENVVIKNVDEVGTSDGVIVTIEMSYDKTDFGYKLPKDSSFVDGSFNRLTGETGDEAKDGEAA